MKYVSFVILLVLVPAVALPQAGQQKKKTTTTTQSAQKEGARVAEKQAEKSLETMHDMLVRYEGLSTNLGRLVKTGKDFVVFEKGDVSLVVALGAIFSIQEIPPDEDDEVPAKTLKIRLGAMD